MNKILQDNWKVPLWKRITFNWKSYLKHPLGLCNTGGTHWNAYILEFLLGFLWSLSSLTIFMIFFFWSRIHTSVNWTQTTIVTRPDIAPTIQHQTNRLCQSNKRRKIIKKQKNWQVRTKLSFFLHFIILKVSKQNSFIF